MKRFKSSLITLAIGTATLSVLCSVFIESAYPALYGIPLGAFYGAFALVSPKSVKTA